MSAGDQKQEPEPEPKMGTTGNCGPRPPPRSLVRVSRGSARLLPKRRRPARVLKMYNSFVLWLSRTLAYNSGLQPE